MLKKLHEPHPNLERFAMFFFSLAVVFTATSFLPPWHNAYEQTTAAVVGFSSIVSSSVYELGDSSNQVTNNELNVGAAWDALTSYEAKVIYPASN